MPTPRCRKRRRCAPISALAADAAAAVQADLGDHAQVLKLVLAAAPAVGPLTLLVNNASMFEADGIGSLDCALFDRHMAVHVRAPLFLAQAFAAQAPAGADVSIVNLLDSACIAAAAVSLLCAEQERALCRHHHPGTGAGPEHPVNGVAPGPTLPSRRQSPEEFARQTENLPLGHGTTPEQVAQAVLFLAGVASVTGQTVAVDGGQHLAWRTPDVAGIHE